MFVNNKHSFGKEIATISLGVLIYWVAVTVIKFNCQLKLN